MTEQQPQPIFEFFNPYTIRSSLKYLREHSDLPADALIILHPGDGEQLLLEYQIKGEEKPAAVDIEIEGGGKIRGMRLDDVGMTIACSLSCHRGTARLANPHLH